MCFATDQKTVKTIFVEIVLKLIEKENGNHLPVGVVWDEVATVLDTGLTGLR